MMNIIEYGDSALLINFEQKIDLEINKLVNAYFKSINKLDYILYQIPAYCSLTVRYDKSKTSYHDLKSKIEEIEIDQLNLNEKSNLIEIPVCYDLRFGVDLESLSNELGLSINELVKLHTSQEYYVFMMGFLPGFPYLGKLPEKLKCKRKDTPRKRVDKGSVAIAGSQTGIYPINAPGGWQIIGRTPIEIFDASKEEGILLNMGDKVKFKSIDQEEYKELAQHGS